MCLLLALSLICLGVVFSVYLLYFVFILCTKKKERYIETLEQIIQCEINSQELPNVTILMPTYNEEETIHAKIRNISEFDYPQSKIKLFVLDDNSIDKTREIAESAFKIFGINGKVFRNETRRGVNASYNIGVEKADSEFILTTDADITIPQDTLLKGIKILLSLEDVGGVTATSSPTHDEATPATRTADTYYSWLRRMYIAESAVFSTFPGATGCMLFRKSAFSTIPVSYGSSDGNISLTIIKNGFKFILAPVMTFFEPVSKNLNELRRQKIRRATRLIQATVANADIAFDGKYRNFGKLIFPLRLLMSVFVPALTILSILFFVAFSFTSLSLLAFFLVCTLLVAVLGTMTEEKVSNLIVSFLTHQFYLFVGLLYSFRKMNVWEHFERKQSSES